MTTDVQSLLESFDMLTKAEQYEAAVEVLRRAGVWESVALTDDALRSIADALSQELDAREAVGAEAEPR